MKKIILALIVFLSITSLCKSQWIQQPVPNDVGILLSIDFANSNIGISGGWILGNGANGRAIYTTNTGTTWNLATVPDSSGAFVKVKLIDAQTGYMAGAYNQSAEKNSYFPIPDYIKNKYNISIIKYWKNIGLSGPVNYKALFVKTTDGGRNWFTYGTLPPQFNHLFAMDFINANTGVVTAFKQDSVFSKNQSTILKTTNGGLSWTALLNLDTIRELRAIKYIDMNLIFAVGFEGTFDTVSSNIGGVILKSTNGGTSWSQQFFPEIEFADIYFPNSSTGFAVGNNQNAYGYIYKTTNQGLNWNITDSLEETLMGGVKFYPESGTGMIYGEYFPPPTLSRAFTSRTTNFGTTWGELQFLDTGHYILTGGILLSPYNEYLTGGDVFSEAVIYHTTNGGSVFVKKIGNLIPEKFSLSQNYPNPFNPKTIINYSIPNTQYTVLKVYDVTGKEITTLVNEFKQAGRYTVEFSATGGGSNLPSGVYFYKLQADGFVETKRMTLIK